MDRKLVKNGLKSRFYQWTNDLKAQQVIEGASQALTISLCLRTLMTTQQARQASEVRWGDPLPIYADV